MKKITLIILAIAALTACGTKDQSFSINGKVELNDVEGKTIYLKKQQEQELVNVDSAKISNGAFTFSGKVDGVERYYIVLENRRPFAVFVENANINVDINNESNNVVGTELNQKATDFVNARKPIMQQLGDVSRQYFELKQNGTLTDSIDKRLTAVDDSLTNQLNKIENDFIVNNINNEIGEYYISPIVSQKEAGEIEQLLSHASKQTLEKDVFKDIENRVQRAKKVEIGQPFVDVVLPGVDGNTMKLSDYAGHGKYVLVDFWASWCGPCRADIPQLVEAYAKYQNKNFEIVGISLDKEKDKWIDAIDKLKITWPQMSDLKFWNCEGAQLYNVRSIPHTVLIDPEGKIIEKNLRGDALKTKLEELLK